LHLHLHLSLEQDGVVEVSGMQGTAQNDPMAQKERMTVVCIQN
jgi:hypothetical protein